ncbi:MAG: MBL fold metallo-hydrolase [Deltaproteobacteria bacterium]|nr:MBL fold metallo-hydrolase [Deltaproteobacteria bacterium]
MLGREESNIYILEGSKESVIISGGLCVIVPEVLRQLKEFNINIASIKKLVILHSHFDHVGVVPYFKRTLVPGIELLGSARTWDLLSQDKALATINLFNKMTISRMNNSSGISIEDCQWAGDIKGSVLREGDEIDVGGLTLTVIETPGHSSCSISLYCPQLKALFPSDGVGIPFRGNIMPAGNSNFTLYQSNLERMKSYDANYVCADHYGYVSGDEAAGYMKDSIEAAARFRRHMEGVYEKKGNINETVRYLVAASLKAYPEYFLPKEILEGIYRQMVRHIAEKLEEQGCR